MAGSRHSSFTFEKRSRAMLLALAAVALLDVLISILSMSRVVGETTGQVQRVAGLHVEQVYEQYSRIGSNMQRLLMENQDLTATLQTGSDREKFAARVKMNDKINYSFNRENDFHFFFYLEQTGELLSDSWIELQDIRESGMLEMILNRLKEEEDMTMDLLHWDYFQWNNSSYLLRAYKYNNVWLICYVPASCMLDSLEKAYENENSRLVLQASDGAVLYGGEEVAEWGITGARLMESGAVTRIWSRGIWMVKEELSGMQLSLAIVTRGYGGFSKIILLQAAVLFMVALTLGAFLMMTIYTKRRIIAPVQKFIDGIQSFKGNEEREQGGNDFQGQRDSGQELSVSDIYELEQVNEQFRNFVHQIGELKISIYEKKLQSQALEINNIKLQMKPHFFLNSLSMIHRFLELGRLEEAGQLCMASIRYLRYLFAAGSKEVAVKEALSHVSDYFEILKLRYPHEVDIDIYVDEQVKDRKVPPLMIQTLVENAFKYGKKADQKLEISVTVTKESYQRQTCLCINVSDNGKGYPEEYIHLWEQGKELDQSEGEHIGIANIRAVLEYTYASRAMTRFYNSPLGGAVAEIYICEEREEQNEPSVGG